VTVTNARTPVTVATGQFQVQCCTPHIALTIVTVLGVKSSKVKRSVGCAESAPFVKNAECAVTCNTEAKR